MQEGEGLSLLRSRVVVCVQSNRGVVSVIFNTQIRSRGVGDASRQIVKQMTDDY